MRWASAWCKLAHLVEHEGRDTSLCGHYDPVWEAGDGGRAHCPVRERIAAKRGIEIDEPCEVAA